MGTFIALAGAAEDLLKNLPKGPYRPAQWSRPQTTSLTCTLPSTESVTSTSTVNGEITPVAPGATETGRPTPPEPTTFFFDAVMRVEHSQEMVTTEHPVQVGPAIVDHAYMRAARVVLEISMSDAMDTYQQGQYSSANSKSVSAYQTFKDIQKARVPILLATRLDSYENMLIEDVRATDDLRTPNALRCVIYLRQIITASVSITTSSVRPDQTGATNEGTKSTQTLDSTTQTLLDSVVGVPQPKP